MTSKTEEIVLTGHQKVVKKKSKFQKHFRRNLDLTLLILPAVIVIFVFQYVPMPGLVLAFKNYNFADGIYNSPTIWFDNFKFLFSSSDAVMAFTNTIAYNAVFMITTIFGSVVLGILLNELKSKISLKFHQTAMFLPHFLSWAIITYVLYAFLDSNNGMFNSVLKSLGRGEIDWYFEPVYWPFIQVFIHFWKVMGHATIIYYACILSIDTTYYEAASIDGASKLQQAIKITIPSITPMIVIQFLGAIGRILNADFGQFFLLPLQSAPLKPVNQVLDTYVYGILLGGSVLGLGTAAGFFQTVVGFALVIITNQVIRNKYGRERAIY